MDHFTLDHLDKAVNRNAHTEAFAEIDPLGKSTGGPRDDSYRKSDTETGKGDIATLGSDMEDYPPEIVEYVTDRKQGCNADRNGHRHLEVVDAYAAEIASATKIARNSGFHASTRGFRRQRIRLSR